MYFLDTHLDTIFGIISKYEVKGAEYCPLCGEEFVEENKLYNVNGIKHRLHLTCGQEVKEAFDEENKEFNEMPNNYLKGSLGALLGALIGCLSFVILYLVGFISSLSAVICIVLGVYFYKKFGGKPNGMMIVITSVISLLMLMLSVYLLYAVTAFGVALEYGLDITLIEAFNMCMEDSQFAAAFTSDLIMTVLFTVIGAGYEVAVLTKKIQRNTKIK